MQPPLPQPNARAPARRPQRRPAPSLANTDAAAPRAYGKLLHRLAPCLLVLLGAALYANTLEAPFVFDDLTELIGSAAVRELQPIHTYFLRGDRRALVNLSLALNHAADGLNPRGYHLVNAAIHVLAGLTLYGVARQTALRTLKRMPLRPAATALDPDAAGRQATGLALAIAAVWLAHPLHTGAVTYVIQRAESLMGLLALLTLYAAIRALDARPLAWGGASVAACTLGMITKEVMVVTPLLVVAYDRVFSGLTLRDVLRHRGPLYAALAATWFTTWFVGWRDVLSAAPNSTAGLGVRTVTPLQYFLTQPVVILHYLGLSFWPSPLVLDYAWPPLATIWPWVANERGRPGVPVDLVLAGGIVAMVVLGVLSAWALWRGRVVGFLGAWFFIILAPTSSFMPLIDLAFEHRMYLPLAAVVSAAVLALSRGLALARMQRPAARAIAPAAFIATVAALAWMTHQRNEDYRDRIRLWRSVVEARPFNPRAQINLAHALGVEGRHREALVHLEQAARQAPMTFEANLNLGSGYYNLGMLEEAERHFLLAQRVRRDDATLLANLARVARDRGRRAQAVSLFEQSLVQFAQNHRVLTELGQMRWEAGDPAAAERLYLQAAKIDSGYVPALARLARLLDATGRGKESLPFFRRSLELNPTNPTLMSDAGWAHMRAGIHPLARWMLSNAVALDPAEPEHARRLAWLLATAPDARVRSGAEALRLATATSQGEGAQDPERLDTLAAALAEVGRFDDAAQAAARAIAAAQADPTQRSKVGPMRQRMDLYRAGKPYRQP